MRNILTLLVLLAVLLNASSALARGAGNDDCPPGSTDPDCVAAAKASGK